MGTLQAHVAVVLAAGGSTRLGRPKQWLRRNGETLLHRSVRLVAETGASRVVVVLGAEHEQLAEALAGTPALVVINPDWRKGLASSLRAAAPQVAASDAVLLVGCDQPALERHHLEALLAGARSARARCAATDTGSAFGIPALVPGAWFDGLDERGDQGFRERLRALDHGDRFSLHAPELARDIDTPEALQQAIAAGWVDGAP